METVSEYKHGSSRIEQVARCGSSKKKQAMQRTTRPRANDFLSCRFLPLYQPAEELPDKSNMEKGFFQSLSNLEKHYSCELMEFKDKTFPYNVLLSHWEASLQLNAKGYQIELSIVQDENDTVCLSTTQAYNTGNTLYYIPVITLYRLLKDRTRKRAGELLLSVFAYLYHVAGVPYYRDSYSALDYYYEMVREWLMEDTGSYDQADLNSNISELEAAQHYGDIMHRKIFNRCHLQNFQQRIIQFSPNDGFDKECLAIAKDYYNLYTQYPDRKISDNIPEVEMDDDDYGYERIRLEQYISFVAATTGWLYDNIEQSVNNEFNECSSMDEPLIRQVFNHKANKEKRQDLDFEYRIFELIGDLCTLLNDMP